MTPQELKNSILQLAIQGKLVEQRAEEGTAKELYKQIQVEKKRLIKAGKIKKEKPLPEIKEDEKQFDIPEGWMWVRLRTVVYNRGQETPSALFCYIDIGSIDNKKQRLNTEENLIDADRAPSRARKVVEFGDILYSTVRPYLHNMCIIDRKFSCKPIASTGFAAMTCYEGIYNKYLFSYLMSPAFDSYANHTENAKGVAYPAINDDRLYRAIVPLPPLAEQKRIVAKIEELLPYIERYEKAWCKLEELNKRFPSDMQKSILQFAIQGKLVEQRIEEGTAEVLYKQIQAEKKRLIKAGKIKKEKPLPEIKEDEKPFDIPEGWMWVRLPEITYGAGNKSNQILAKEVKPEGKYPAVSQGAKLIDGYYDFDEKIVFDLPLVMFGDHTRNVKYIDFPFVVSADGTKFMKAVGVEAKYLYYWMTFVAEHLRSRGYARHFTLLVKEPVPLPPLAEQKRIVAKIEELMPLCERLKFEYS